MLKDKLTLLYPWTIFSATWRALVAICDWRTHLRKIKNQSILDAVFITNMRDDEDRLRFIGKWKPQCGHFNGPRYWVNGTAGRTRALDITTADLASNKGRKEAKEYFFSAVKWSQERGARVILLAASLKRLFGSNGDKLKIMFPNLVFTIGDNGTMFLLKEETFRALKKANLRPDYCKIAVLGPYGLLGEMMVEALSHDYHVIGAGPNKSALARMRKKYGIEICQTFEEMGEVDAVIACTHSEKIRLTADVIRNNIRKQDKKLLIIDVAEPSNFRYSEWTKCQDICIRQDAGNAHNSNLKYVLGAVSYKMFRLTRGVTFGCFAETLTIAAALKRGDKEVIP